MDILINKKNILLLFIIAIFIPLKVQSQLPEVLDFNQSDTVGLYEKQEIKLSIKSVFKNPFDSKEIDVSTEFISPTGKTIKVNGFYDYAYPYLWKIRFSPNELGVWNYKIKIRDNTGEFNSSNYSFYTTISQNKGPIQISKNNRYLEYHNGESFYGVGFWYNDNYSGFNSGKITENTLEHLKDLGVNFISTFITPLETFATGLGRYDQNICGRIDQVLEMCEDKDMILSLNIWFHSYLSETVWGGGNIRWNSNPYKTITEAEDFFSSEEAWEYQQSLYRYFISRWGYSRSLGIWFIVDEVNGTDGWVQGDSLGAAKWAHKIQEYFGQNDPYNHLTTGTRSGGIKEFWHEGYSTFDIASREIYEAQGFPINRTGTLDSIKTHPLQQSYINYSNEIKRLWNGYYKPAIIGETGWDHTFYEMSMPGYLAQYHNALWVSLASGTAMTPFWWAYSNKMNDVMITQQLSNFRKFVDLIDFPKITQPEYVNIKAQKSESFGLSSDKLTFGWVVNAITDVAGDSITVEVKSHDKYRLKIYHTWRGEIIEEKIIYATNGVIGFTIPKLYITSSTHANYIGSDIAFILEPIFAHSPVQRKRKVKKRDD